MLFQICVLAAGAYLGKSLFRSWDEVREGMRKDLPSGRGEGTAPPAAPAASASGGEGPAKGPETALSAPAARKSGPPKASEREEVDEQLELSLLATGLAVAGAALPPLRVLAGVTVLYGSIPIMVRARDRLLQERRVGAEVLDTVGTVTNLATRHVASASLVFLIYAAGRKLKLRTQRATEQQMIPALAQSASSVWVRREGIEVSVPLESLSAGDVVVVSAGSPIPADGVVTGGSALVDQHMLTGEAQPLEKATGDQVLAATIVTSGHLHVRVLVTGERTVAAGITEILRTTADFTSSLEAQGQRVADRLALPTLLLGAAAIPLVGATGGVAILQSSFLDNMRFFTPISMLQYLQEAYAAGILVKDGRSLQVLPRVDTVVFDKTGTLTLGQLRVSRVHTAGATGEDEILACAAAAEHRQTHPVALAILDEAESRGQIVSRIDGADYEVGFGITARAAGRTVRVGSRRFLEGHGTPVPGSLAAAERDSHEQGSSLVYVARDEEVLGLIELAPNLRPEVPAVLGALRERGCALHLISGDHEAPTRAFAEALGFDRYVAGVLPADKARLVEELTAQGRTVCFVGDGINDAIALKKASVSVSMGGASTAATNSAQIVLLRDGLDLLPRALAIGDGYQRSLGNLMLALGIPQVIGIGGVFFAGFRVPAVTALYGAAMLAGTAVTMAPHWKRGKQGAPGEPVAP